MREAGVFNNSEQFPLQVKMSLFIVDKEVQVLAGDWLLFTFLPQQKGLHEAF